MNVREADLIGIGKKYQIHTDYNEEVIIVIHDDGRRELYSYDAEEDTSTPVMTLSDSDARQVAGIIGGLSYKPKALETIEVALHDLVIEWYKIPPESPAYGKTIGELAVRKVTGAAIIAAVKNEGSVINPGPDYVLTEDTTLVVSGQRTHINLLKDLLLGK